MGVNNLLISALITLHCDECDLALTHSRMYLLSVYVSVDTENSICKIMILTTPKVDPTHSHDS